MTPIDTKTSRPGGHRRSLVAAGLIGLALAGCAGDDEPNRPMRATGDAAATHSPAGAQLPGAPPPKSEKKSQDSGSRERPAGKQSRDGRRLGDRAPAAVRLLLEPSPKRVSARRTDNPTARKIWKLLEPQRGGGQAGAPVAPGSPALKRLLDRAGISQ